MNQKAFGEYCDDCQCSYNPSGFCFGCVNKWLFEAEEKGRIEEGLLIMESLLKSHERYKRNHR